MKSLLLHDLLRIGISIKENLIFCQVCFKVITHTKTSNFRQLTSTCTNLILMCQISELKGNIFLLFRTHPKANILAIDKNKTDFDCD